MTDEISQSVPVPQYNLVPLVSWVWRLCCGPCGSPEKEIGNQSPTRTPRGRSPHLILQLKPVDRPGILDRFVACRCHERTTRTPRRPPRLNRMPSRRASKNFELPRALVTREAKS